MSSLLCHVQQLDNLCRLCARKVIKSKSYIHPKSCSEYADILKKCYGICCELESKDIYPKYLCGSCKRKLEDLRKAPRYIGEPSEFQAHVDLHCWCLKSSKRTQPLSGLRMKLCDAEFEKADFKKVDNIQLNYKRIYFSISISDFHVSSPVSISINNDFVWEISVNQRTVDKGNIVNLCGFSDRLSDENISQFASACSSLKVCPGHGDFEDVLDSRLDIKDFFLNQSGTEKVADVETINMSKLDRVNFKIIRHVKCQLLIDKSVCICSNCGDFRGTLLKIRSRINSTNYEDRGKWVSSSSSTNLRYLSLKNLKERYTTVQTERQAALAKVARLSMVVSKLIEQESVVVEKEQESFFKDVIANNDVDFKEDSPQWLLWQQQKLQVIY